MGRFIKNAKRNGVNLDKNKRGRKVGVNLEGRNLKQAAEFGHLKSEFSE